MLGNCKAFRNLAFVNKPVKELFSFRCKVKNTCESVNLGDKGSQRASEVKQGNNLKCL